MTETGATPIVAVIGGTGKEGHGLAYRWAKAGLEVIVGSREAERAGKAASQIRELVGNTPAVSGAANHEAARRASIVVLTVPYAAHREILESIKPWLEGKLLIDATVPLVRGSVSRAQMPPAGSAAQEARQILGEGAEVAAAFHNVSHELLLQKGPIDCDVLVTGTSRQARNTALDLVAAAGLRGWDAGSLENAAVSEGLASVLIHINKRYGSVHSGFRVTGVEQS